MNLGFTINGQDDHSNSTEPWQNPFTTATQLIPESSTVYGESGKLEYAGDKDVFQWTAPENGAFLVRLTAANNSQFYPDMYVWDQEKKYIRQLNGVDNFAANGGPLSGSAQVIVTAVAGAKYLITAGDNIGRNLGTYRITLERFEDDHPNEPLNQAATVVENLDQSISGIINRSGDTDWFKVSLPGESEPTRLVIDCNNMVGGGFTLFRRNIQDESKNSGFTTVASGGTNGSGTIVREFVREENVAYYLRFFESQAGQYSFRFESVNNTVDDHGNRPGTATNLVMDATQKITASGIIEFADDTDVFSLPSLPANKAADIRITSLLPIEVAIVDAQGALVTRQGPGNTTFQLIRNGIDLTGSYARNENGTYGFVYLPEGMPSFLRIRSPSNLTGQYSLQINAVEYKPDGNDDPDRLPPAIEVQGPLQNKPLYAITHATDADWYVYTASRDGSLALFCNPLSNDLRLEIQVKEDIDSYQTERMDSSRRKDRLFGMSFDVQAGKTYNIRVLDLQCGIGQYELEMKFLDRESDHIANRFDDYPEPPAFAQFTTKNGGLNGTYRGRLDHQGDIDMIAWVAPVSGTATYTMSANDSDGNLSALFPDIYVARVVEDDWGFPISRELEAARGGPFAGTSMVQFPVIAGRTYLFSNGDNHGRGIGPFISQITIEGDDFSNIIFSNGLQLGAYNYDNTSSNQNNGLGFINQPGDIDLFQFNVPAAGNYFVQMATGSKATGTILDAFGNPVGLNQLLAHSTYYASITGSEVSQYKFVITQQVIPDFELPVPTTPVTPLPTKTNPTTDTNPNPVITQILTTQSTSFTDSNFKEIARVNVALPATNARDNSIEKPKDISNSTNSASTLFLDNANGQNVITIDLGKQNLARDSVTLELRGIANLVHTGSIQQSVSQDPYSKGTVPESTARMVAPILDHAVSVLDGTEWYGMAFGSLAWNGLMAPTRLNLLPNPTPTNKFISALGQLIDSNLENNLQMVEEKEEFPWISIVIVLGIYQIHFGSKKMQKIFP